MSEEIKPGNLPEEPTKEERKEPTKEVPEISEIPVKPPKNPKRVSAGKRGAEARKMKAALKRKELEEIKEENQRLKNIELKGSITKDEHAEKVPEIPEVPEIIKNYLPFVAIGVIGLGLGFYWMKPWATQAGRELKKTVPTKKEGQKPEKEIDPFEF